MELIKCDVLVVEDDPNITFFLERAFDKAGLMGPLCIVRDGDEAMAYFNGEGKYADRKKHPIPALVLLDLRLPKKSGLEVLQWLRKQPDVGRIPVVILTLTASPEDINRAYALGANSVLLAPLNAEGLLETVKAIRQYWLVFNLGPIPPNHKRTNNP
jgi:DNA-binding response OmpR family regulator